MAISLDKKNSSSVVTPSRILPDAIMVQLSNIVGNLRKPVKANELIFFSSQLSLMLEIGTSVTNALQAIAEQTSNPAFKKIVHEILLNVEEGRQLSEALRRHPRAFNNTYVSMVRAGETGGFLKKVLDGIVEMQEKRQNLITQLRSTLTYPAVLGTLSIAVVIFVLVGILPKFTTLFEGKESLLPFTTLFLMAASASLKTYWWIYIISFAGLLMGIKIWTATNQGKRVIDWFLINAPIIAGLTNKIYTTQLLRTLGHLMESQVPLLQALEVTQTTFENQFYKEFIDDLREHVEQGGRFAQPFATSPYILESVKQMVATGEEVGNLPKVMLRLAEFYDTETDRDLKVFASMIEPIALVMLGAVVGLIVASVILPIFKIANAVH
jgi:type II secretory pathway component PulF